MFQGFHIFGLVGGIVRIVEHVLGIQLSQILVKVYLKVSEIVILWIVSIMLPSGYAFHHLSRNHTADSFGWGIYHI